MDERGLARLAVTLFAVTMGLFVGVGAFSAIHGWSGDAYVPIIFLVWSAVGLVLAVRLPRNAVGWIFLVAILCWAVSGLSGHYGIYGLGTAPGALPGALWAYWLSTWMWIPGLVLVPTFGLLLFPDGRLPSRRWRWVAWPVAIGIVLGMVSYFVVPWQGNEDEFGPIPGGVDNPLLSSWFAPLHDALFVVFAVLVLVGIGGGALALVVRYWRSRGQVRQQLRWAAFGGIVSVAVYLTGGLTTRLPGIEWWLITLVAATLFPVTIAVAVLRYRLYDIDRIVSRAVAYAVSTVVLVGVYVVGVIGFGAVVRAVAGDAGGDLVVAASTLLVAAAFGPVRRRAQTHVDRRFNRARYDARAALERFAQRTRDDVDLLALERDLRALVATTLRPDGVSLWLRARAEGRR